MSGIPCPSCPSSDAYNIHTNDKGEDWGHCFSCGINVPQQQTRYKVPMCQLQYEKGKSPLEAEEIIQLPSNFSTKIPLKILYELDKYSLTMDLLKSYNIGYCDRISIQYNRKITGEPFVVTLEEALIIPVYSDHRLAYYQARSYKKGYDGVKYWTRGHKDALATSLPTSLPISYPVEDTLYIVEDFMSMMRVGKHSPCVALMGSSVGKILLAQILDYMEVKKLKRIKLFLDNDSTGVKQSKIIRKSLLPFYEVEEIDNFLESDPKSWHENDLKTLIGAV